MAKERSEDAPLQRVAAGHHIKTMKLPLAHGANPNIHGENYEDVSACTVLLLSFDTDITPLFLDEGATYNLIHKKLGIQLDLAVSKEKRSWLSCYATNIRCTSRVPCGWCCKTGNNINHKTKRFISPVK